MYHIQLTLGMNYRAKTGNITEQRLVTMSVSLHTQTGLHCLTIQFLNIKSLLPKYLIHFSYSLHSNLENGLAILTESFSPLKSKLHNLPY